MTRFVFGATTLQFNVDPVRPYGKTVQLLQRRERDSSGDPYVYHKNSLKRYRHRLRFTQLTDTVLASLLAFLGTVAGVQNTFTWYDHEDTTRTVRFATPSISSRPQGPNRNTVTIELEEDL